MSGSCLLFYKSSENCEYQTNLVDNKVSSVNLVRTDENKPKNDWILYFINCIEPFSLILTKLRLKSTKISLIYTIFLKYLDHGFWNAVRFIDSDQKASQFFVQMIENQLFCWIFTKIRLLKIVNG